MNGGWVRPNTRWVNLLISITLGSQFFTQWNPNKSLSDSGTLIYRKDFSVSPYNKMGLKCDLIRISHNKFCSGRPVSRHLFQDTESLLDWGITDNFCFSYFCKFSDHRSLQQIEFFPLLRFFNFIYLFNGTFICSWIILLYSPDLFDQIKFFVRLYNLPRLFASLLRNGGWFSFQMRLVS